MEGVHAANRNIKSTVILNSDDEDGRLTAPPPKLAPAAPAPLPEALRYQTQVLISNDPHRAGSSSSINSATPTFSPGRGSDPRFPQAPLPLRNSPLRGAERLSRYDFAVLVAQLTGADESLLKRVRMTDHSGPAKRPADCSLVSNKIRNALGIEPMSCLAGLSSVPG